MAGLFDILGIAKSALSASYALIDTTGNNVANAQTDGYSRQRVVVEASDPVKKPYGLLGTGVSILSVQRIHDDFIDAQIQSTNSYSGKATSQQSILSQIEALFNEPSTTGLSSIMDNFFNGFQNLANSPEDSTARVGVLQQADVLTQTLNEYHSSLQNLQDGLKSDITSKINSINTLAQQIHDLNVQVAIGKATNISPNDLMDKRDSAINQLSQLAKVTTTQQPDGSITVSVGGALIASRDLAATMTSQIQNGKVMVYTDTSSTPLNIQSGTLGGTLEAYNTTIPGYMDKLDTMASTLISSVNALHSTGFGLGTPPATGNNFFTGTNASDIAVNAALENNPNLVAASIDGSTGDNQVALAIANLSNAAIMNGNSTSLKQYYATFVSGLGTEITNATNTQNTQSLVAQQLQAQQTSTSGVSIDEEMTNLIQYQRSYEASARLVNTVNDMFTTLFNSMG